MVKNNLVLFRKDLRIHDNKALYHACSEGKVLALYIFDDNLFFSDRQKLWAYHSVQVLKKNLKHINIELIILQGDTCDGLSEIVKKYSIDNVYINRLYGQIEQDEKIKLFLTDNNVNLQVYNSHLLFVEDDEIKIDEGKYYRTFFSFRKKALKCVENIPRICSFSSKNDQKTIKNEQKINNIALKQGEKTTISLQELSITNANDQDLKAGEDNANIALDDFVKNHVASYHLNRHCLDKVCSSYLSIHIHFGEISVLSIWNRLSSQQLLSEDDSLKKGILAFLDQICWREFSYYLLKHYPTFPTQDLNPRYLKFEWLNSSENLKKWQDGQTGYPIVDAGMIQLKKEGWISNRMRLIVSSFLTKHLLLDWRLGADWFLKKLFDADIANNTLGWQWITGSYPGGNTYLRILSPYLQQERFDPKKIYISKWIDKNLYHEYNSNCENPDKLIRKVVQHEFAMHRAKSAFRSFLAEK